jgi:hypothetical protein
MAIPLKTPKPSQQAIQAVRSALAVMLPSSDGNTNITKPFRPVNRWARSLSDRQPQRRPT